MPGSNCCSRERPRLKRGAILLECILSLAILVGAGLAVLALIDRASGALAASRDAESAADLARSAMSKLEAGLGSVQTLAGPVEPWRDERDGTFDDALPEESPWSIAIDVEPAEFPGLTLVTVTAEKTDPLGRTLAVYALRQFVRLQSADAAGAGDAPIEEWRAP